jgi:MYXO-CTERM domain-containing protein
VGRGTVVFFNRQGGVYTQGDNDSRTNTTSIHAGTLTPFECGDAKWAQVMACLKTSFLPYDVKITDVDPGPAREHIETVVAGTGAQLGQPTGVGGIAPLGCELAYDNPVAFAFSGEWGCDVNKICWAAAQETAHTLGLDHSTECTDAMTYDQDCGTLKRFIDVDKPCGEDKDLAPDTPPPAPSGPRRCKCTNKLTQNSHETLLEIFGSRENGAPELSFVRPHDGQAVTRGFALELSVDDDFGLATVDLSIDGQSVATLSGSPFATVAPATLADGAHTITARAHDTGGLTTEVTIHVTQQPPCAVHSDCPATAVCSQGECIDGPNAPGGLGATCGSASECGSGICDPGPDGQRCTQDCDPAASTCPMGYECLNAGTRSACWPGADVLAPRETSGCGCHVGRAHRAPGLALGLALVGLVLAFRRRRR